jgi:DNA-binding TFAR19-related protein (PDSD5 family)
MDPREAKNQNEFSANEQQKQEEFRQNILSRLLTPSARERRTLMTLLNSGANRNG